MADLSLPLKAAVLKELGGPEPEPEDYENYAAAHKDQPAVLEELDGPQRGPEYWEAYAAAYEDSPFVRDPCAAAAAKADAVVKSKSPATVFDGEPSRTAVAGKKKGNTATCHGEGVSRSRKSPGRQEGSPRDKSTARDPPQSRAGRRRVQSRGTSTQ